MLPLPEPLDFDWPLKSPTSARTTMTPTRAGGFELAIEHEIIRGISTEMLEWWFQNLDRDFDYRGQRLHAYRMWHPLDHIRIDFTRDEAGRIAPGQRVHIQEVFGRDPRNRIDEHVWLHRWDRYGIGLHATIAGIRMFELNHQFDDVPGGVQYRSRARIGAFSGLVGGMLTRVALPRRFPPQKATAWFKHNIEEVGCFENFLPELYAANRS